MGGGQAIYIFFSGGGSYLIYQFKNYHEVGVSIQDFKEIVTLLSVIQADTDASQYHSYFLLKNRGV